MDGKRAGTGFRVEDRGGHWSSLYYLPGQDLQVKANVAKLFEMIITH